MISDLQLFHLQWLDRYGCKIADFDAFDKKRANHVLVNEYLSGQGIMVCIK